MLRHDGKYLGVARVSVIKTRTGRSRDCAAFSAFDNLTAQDGRFFSRRFHLNKMPALSADACQPVQLL